MDVSKIADSILKEASVKDKAFKEIDDVKRELDRQVKLLKEKLSKVEKILSKRGIKITNVEMNPYGSFYKPDLKLSVSFTTLLKDPDKSKEIIKELSHLVGKQNISLDNIWISVK